MKAVMFIPRPGGAAVEVREVPKPAPGAGEVLVRVAAAALNRGELAVREKLVSGAPVPTGIEFTGEVVELGAGAGRVRPGQRVMGHWRAGQAEYVAVDERLLVPVPDRLSWVEAAGWLNVFTTAHDAIVTNAELEPGESILVNAASSGIGVASLQIARLLGAKPVIASSRSRAKLDALGAYGMEVAIDDGSDRYAEEVAAATSGKGADVVVDSVGANVIDRNLRSAALGGRIISVGRVAAERGEIDLDYLAYKRVKLLGVTFRTRTLEQRAACVQRCAADLLQPLADGRLTSVVHRTYRMEEVAEAHQAMARNEHVGKLVLMIAA
jgi:NADPH:quinone reductase